MSLNAPLNRRLRMMLLGGGGTGFIGRVHRTAAMLDGRAELVAGAFSSDPGRCSNAAESFGVSQDRVSATFEELFEAEGNRGKDDRCDFVSVATPNWLHFPMASGALRAGFHVVCDKPMTISSEQADELVRLVEETGRVFALTHNYTGYPLVRQAREMIAGGELGEIHGVRVNYIQGWLRGLKSGETAVRGVWKDDSEKNGPAAAMGDIGSHAYNLARYITGLEPVELSSTLQTVSPGRQLDDYGHALVRMQNDALCMINVSQVTHGRLNDLSIEVDGDKAALSWRQEEPNVLLVRQFGEPQRIYDRHPVAAFTNQSGREACRLPAGHPEAFFEAFANVYSAAFDDMIAFEVGMLPGCGRRDSVYPNVYDGREGVRFIEQCVASSQSGGSWVPLSA